MKIVDNAAFLAHIGNQGISLDYRYSEPRTLVLEDQIHASIPFPPSLNSREKFLTIRLVLDLIDKDAAIWLWRRGGTWRFEHSYLKGTVDRTIRALLGVDESIQELAGTVSFSPGEREILTSIVFLNSIVAGSVPDDLFVVPEDQGFILHFDHDEQINLQFEGRDTRDRILGTLLPEMKRLGLSSTFA